jgi:hypothetical protein
VQNLINFHRSLSVFGVFEGLSSAFVGALSEEEQTPHSGFSSILGLVYWVGGESYEFPLKPLSF